jgi:hypothetical protein
MKYLKMLGLAVLAIAALAALVGAANAQATVLCKTNAGAECGKEVLPVGTKLNTQLEIAEKFTLLSTGGGEPEVECKESAMTPEIVKAGSATTTVEAKVPAASITWGACSATTTTVSGGEIEFHWINATTNASVTGKGISVKFVGGGLTCIYGFGAAMIPIGTFTGGLVPRIHLKAVATKQAGSDALCQSDEIMQGEYEIQPNGEEKAMYAREK